jgi:3-phenylpropionate/cinnamic acid dioxygenase small subunit
VSTASGVALDERLLPGGMLHGRVVHFYSVEADLLDSHRYADWFELFHPEISYEMPVRTTELLAVGDGVSEMAFFSENWSSIKTRVRRLQTDFAWAEAPPSRTRHFVTNVMITEAAAGGALSVQSNVLVNRTRGDGGNQTLTAFRRDELVPDSAKLFLVRRRYLLLDQTVVAATNLSVFL